MRTRLRYCLFIKKHTIIYRQVWINRDFFEILAISTEEKGDIQNAISKYKSAVKVADTAQNIRMTPLEWYSIIFVNLSVKELKCTNSPTNQFF